MLTIGTVLAQARKQRGVPQQAVADFVGVSKASVSKWETGQAYPDITTLPLLAAYFDLTVDQLLGYTATLAPAALHRLYRELQAAFQTESAAAMATRIAAVVHRYYASAPVLIAMGTLVLNHYDLLPGADLAEKKRTHVAAARDWFTRALALQPAAAEVDKATKLAAMCDLLLNDPAAVLAKLGTTTPEWLPAASLIAWAQQLTGETAAAVATVQSSLYQDVTVLLSELTNYLTLISANQAKLAATFARGQAVIDAFAVAQLNPLAALNFWSAAAVAFAEHRSVTQVAPVLDRLGTTLQGLQEPLTLHGDAYFDQVADWLAATDQGGAAPRNSGHMRRDLARQLLADPRLAALREAPALAGPLATLTALAKEETR